MKIFDKFKNIFNKNNETKKEDTTLYEKGLEKTRKEFVSKLNLLGIKYTKIDDEYFEELEQLIQIIVAKIAKIDIILNFICQKF